MTLPLPKQPQAVPRVRGVCRPSREAQFSRFCFWRAALGGNDDGLCESADQPGNTVGIEAGQISLIWASNYSKSVGQMQKVSESRHQPTAPKAWRYGPRSNNGKPSADNVPQDTGQQPSDDPRRRDPGPARHGGNPTESTALQHPTQPTNADAEAGATTRARPICTLAGDRRRRAGPGDEERINASGWPSYTGRCPTSKTRASVQGGMADVQRGNADGPRLLAALQCRTSSDRHGSGTLEDKRALGEAARCRSYGAVVLSVSAGPTHKPHPSRGSPSQTGDL
ncbi:hypothetical protein HIM_07854 [Hirsutella minnesotensis 3608]|uniref:Uncharacterized protein n=1 Tax=Hirsutella minnesotensis 3608 TaxID=1043627 RepID=A0A0F8A413_9HYPO|nr:hypothetical protein HIM_07854 [Hirsutella minnesotensis 3608]